MSSALGRRGQGENHRMFGVGGTSGDHPAQPLLELGHQSSIHAGLERPQRRRLGNQSCGSAPALCAPETLQKQMARHLNATRSQGPCLLVSHPRSPRRGAREEAAAAKPDSPLHQEHQLPAGIRGADDSLRLKPSGETSRFLQLRMDRFPVLG